MDDSCTAGKLTRRTIMRMASFEILPLIDFTREVLAPFQSLTWKKDEGGMFAYGRWWEVTHFMPPLSDWRAVD